MHNLFKLIGLVLFIFVTNAGAAVLMDEVVPNQAFQSASPQSNGYRNALETNSGHIASAGLTMPMKAYVLAGNNLDPQAIVQEKPTEPTQNINPFLLGIALIGLILFIVRRRTSN